MENQNKPLITFILFIFSMYGYAEIGNVNHGELLNSRIETLENGDQIRVPSDVITIPGHPIVVPPEYFVQIEAEKIELKKYGFVDRPMSRPIATSAFRSMKNEFLLGVRLKQDNGSRVQDIKDYDYSEIKTGKVSPNILTAQSKGFIINNHQSIIRAYSNTKFGDIYINEMIGATMGVVTGPASPNLFVDNFEGYITTVRYEFGQMATLILMNTADGVSFIEIVDSFSGNNNESDLHEFLAVLLRSKEGN